MDAAAVTFDSTGLIVITSVGDVKAALDLVDAELAELDAAYAPRLLTIEDQSGTSYTVDTSDPNRLIRLSNAGAITVTLPQDSDVSFLVGLTVTFVQTGAGQVTFSAGTGATVNSTPTAKTRAQYSAVTAIKTAANTWLLVGDLAAS